MTSNFSAARVVLVAVAAACVALVIAALLVVALRPSAPLHEESTPKGVVQRYLLAYEAGDLDAVRDYTVDGESRQLCNPESLGSGQLDIQLIRSTASGSRASVHARIEGGDSTILPLLDGSSYEDVFELRMAQDRWLIERMPWQVGLCTEKELGY